MDAAGSPVTPVTVVLQATSRRPATEQDAYAASEKLCGTNFPRGKLALAMIKVTHLARSNLDITLLRPAIYLGFSYSDVYQTFGFTRSKYRCNTFAFKTEREKLYTPPIIRVNFLRVLAVGALFPNYIIHLITISCRARDI